LETRRLGSEGPAVSVIGFGAWAAGGSGWGTVDDGQTVAAIRRSVELGATFIDTAEVYGAGHSEEIVAEAVAGMGRDDFFLATKVSGDDLSPTAIKRAIDGSLRRLGLDYVDLYQMHWPDPRSDVQESMQAMADLVRDGKVRFVGASNFGVELMRQCLEVRRLDSLQPPLNLLEREIETEILPFCRENGIGVVVYSPMAKGLLTGKYQEGDRLPASDVRGSDPLFQGETFRRNLRVIDRLRSVAERLDVTLGQLAVAWTLSRPGVTVSIVGAKRPSQVDENVGAADCHLTDNDLAEIEDILSSTD